MARIKKETEEANQEETSEKAVVKEVKIDVSKMLTALRKKNESVSFKDSAYGEISHYISTGDMGLNMVLSGKPDGGIPAGRVVMFAGENSTGKTLCMSYIIKNALLESNYDHIFYFDSEGGLLKDSMIRHGINLEQVEHVLIDSVEDLTVKVLNTLKTIEEIKKVDPTKRFMLCLDSIGNIVSNKVYVDALEKDKNVSDQGARAKSINVFIKSVTVPCLKTDTPFLIANHVYDNPADMYKSAIKNMGGGKGLQYVGSIVVQITRSLEKNENTDDGEAKYGATILKFFTVKNRIVKQFYSSEMFLHFSKGPLRYFGLISYAIKFGLITKKTAVSYTVDGFGERLFKLKEITFSDEVWKAIMPKLKELAETEFSYSSSNVTEEQQFEESKDKIEKLIEETSEPKQ